MAATFEAFIHEMEKYVSPESISGIVYKIYNTHFPDTDHNKDS